MLLIFKSIYLIGISINPQYIAILLRIADYLDIDETRAPKFLYDFIAPTGYSKTEWDKHYVVKNSNKIFLSNKNELATIPFYGESHKPDAHRKILSYIASINTELKRSIGYSKTFEDNKYKLMLPPYVEKKINCIGFSFSDFRLNLDYVAVTKLLMGANIYGSKEYGLRELIQNSIDACKILKEDYTKLSSFKYEKYNPEIKIIINSENDTVTIKDNGKGMSLDMLKKYFLNIGVSYYSSDEYTLTGKKYKPIGNLGIGFLSCLMLSDNIKVRTELYGTNEFNEVEFEKSSQYITLKNENKHFIGTEIILSYIQFDEAFNGDCEKKIENFLTDNFLDAGIKICIIIENNGNEFEENFITFDLGKENSLDYMNIDKYLQDINSTIGYKKISIEPNLIKSLSDISSNTCYVLNSEDKKLTIMDDLTNIYDYVVDGEINYFEIDIIGDYELEKYEILSEALGNRIKAIYKLEIDDSINIFINKDFPNYYEYFKADRKFFISGNEIFSGYYYSDLCEQFGHCEEIPANTEVKRVKVIENCSSKLLEYFEGPHENKNFQLSFIGDIENKNKVYCKYVKLKNSKIDIPFLVANIKIKSIIVNLFNKSITPNIARDNIPQDKLSAISYAIGKALHLWILDNISLDNDVKSLLENFVLKKYGDYNEFMKK